MNFPGLNCAIHKDGLKFVAITAATSFVLMTFCDLLGWIGMALTVFCAFFFRNPKRMICLNDNQIVSPADGTVCAINFEVPCQDLGLGDKQRFRVSIFLSLFDVHVNRAPCAGTIRNILYHPGSFLNASFDKASVFNERNTVVLALKNDSEKIMAFTQIAGMIARRIVCDVHEGQSIKKGEVFGLIRFGSRCDVWLPIGAVPSVIKGQKMVAGESVIADLSITNQEIPEGFYA
jgi:phosphatidylserine decarboxylase